MIKESTRREDLDGPVLWFREIPTVTGNQNRAASSCGCHIDLVVMVPETKRDIRRFDEDGDSLKLPDRVSQGIAVTGMLRSFSDSLVFCKNRVRKDNVVPPHYIVDHLPTDAGNPSC